MPDPRKQAARAAELLKTLAHPVRLGIVSVLCEGDEHVGALAERLHVAPAAVSQSLALLRTQRLVAVTRRDGFAFYRLQATGLRDVVRSVARLASANDAARHASGAR